MKATRDSSHVSRDYFFIRRTMDIRLFWRFRTLSGPAPVAENGIYLFDPGREPVLLETLGGGGGKRMMTLEEYTMAHDPSVYYKTSRHLDNVLAADIRPLEQFNCWYAGTAVGKPKSRLSWLYVGVKDSFSELHRDIWLTSAWNYLIKGLNYLYTLPPTGAIDRISVVPGAKRA